MKAGRWAEIHRLKEFEKLSARSIAELLHCSRDSVAKALALPEPPAKKQAVRPSIIEPFKPAIQALIDKTSELSAVRVLEEIAKKGYQGEITLVRDYLREIRPSRARVYQEVEYAPAQAMQVDWGYCGLARVDDIYRKVWVFVAVLCYSRLMYIAFTLSQSKQTFYRCIVRAMTQFRGCPLWIIVDNLKAAVLRGSGRQAVFHPEFEALCAHYARMKPVACEKADPETKGIVEAGVGYVKKNALQGRKDELIIFEDYLKLAPYWLDAVANMRIHDSTRERPIDRFEKEQLHLRPLPALPYDTDDINLVVGNSHARVRFDTNRYSVPPEFARKPLTLRADDNWVVVIHAGREVARHKRSFQKRQIIVDPQHRQAALACRKRSLAREIEARFDDLGPEAKAFRVALLKSPVRPSLHLRKILDLVRLYGKAEVLGAISKAIEHQTCDASYVRNIIDQERRKRHMPSPTSLCPKRKDLIEEVDFDEPDPSDYDHLMEEQE
jgi:transposase